MYNSNKLSIIITCLILLNLTSCTSPNKNSISDNNPINQIYLNSRTIDKNHKVSVLDNFSSENLGKYDYNEGVYSLPPVGQMNENINYDLNGEEIQNSNSSEENNEEILFTLEEVQKITDDLYNEYNEILNANSNDYENYINALSNNYLNLENEYLSLLKDISSFIESPEENILNNESPNQEIVENKNEDNEDKKEVDLSSYTEEERLDILYREALETASKNLDEFEPIQGQAPSEDKNFENTESKNSESQIKENELQINANVIFNMINENLSLPNFEERDLEFLVSNYKFSKDKISDFKIVNSKDNNFEMLILDISNISDEELVNSIEFRMESILNLISENTNTSFNLDEKVLVLNIDKYFLFCFSDINNSILNFLESI